MEPHYYHVDIAWNKDRKGMMCSPERMGVNLNSEGCIEVATPPEFPKGIPGIWSPEHLFTGLISNSVKAKVVMKPIVQVEKVMA
jgi:hypothetical protein